MRPMKSSFWPNLGFCWRSGMSPPAGKDVLKPDAVLQPHADVARFAIVLPVVLARILDRHPADDRNAMMHPLPVELAIFVAVAVEQLEREDGVEHLGLLKTQDVRLLLGDQPLDQSRARAHRVDVPGCDLQPFGHNSRLAS